MLKVITFIGLGSFLGGVARYGLSRAAVDLAGISSFWGTMAANIDGVFFDRAVLWNF